MIRRTEIQMLSDFMTGINAMIDAASQMVHQRMNPKFMAIRDMLQLIKDDAIKLIRNESNDPRIG